MTTTAPTIETLTPGGQQDAKRRSLWLREVLPDGPAQPPLAGAERADVAIIGGGFVGLWTAIRLKQDDPACDVVMLEQDICAGGASGRNGGMALTWGGTHRSHA